MIVCILAATGRTAASHPGSSLNPLMRSPQTVGHFLTLGTEVVAISKRLALKPMDAAASGQSARSTSSTKVIRTDAPPALCDAVSRSLLATRARPRLCLARIASQTVHVLTDRYIAASMRERRQPYRATAGSGVRRAGLDRATFVVILPWWRGRSGRARCADRAGGRWTRTPRTSS